MAAPANEFLAKKLGNLDEGVEELCQIGVRDGTNAVLKDRYYLDFVLSAAEYDPANMNNELPQGSGFVGGCIIGSNNYYMHNLNRIWSVGSTVDSNEVLYHDAGKNTFGTAHLGAVVKKFANNIQLGAQFKASWHNDTTQIGVIYRKRGTTVPFSELLDNHLVPKQSTLNTLNYRFLTGLQKDDEIEVRAVNVNEEGKYNWGNTVYIVLDAPVFAYTAEFRDQPCVPGTLVSVYMQETDRVDLVELTEDPIMNPTIRLFEDPEMEIKADSGWYFGLDGSSTRSYFVNPNGFATHYNPCGGTPPVEYELMITASDSGFGTWYLRFDLLNVKEVPVTILGRFSRWENGSEIAGGYNINVTIPAGQKSQFRDTGRGYNTNEDWRFTITLIDPDMTYLAQV